MTIFRTLNPNATARWLLALAVGLALFAVACGSDAPAATPTATGSPDAEPTIEGSITVFAASSLTDAFKEAAKEFQAKHPGVTVTFNFAASSALAAQINEGAPADVFASADSNQMKVVTDRGNAANPAVFVTNVPVVVTPKSGSPVTSFADLAKPGVRLILAGPEVPIGRYAREVLTNASNANGGVSTDFSQKTLANLKSNEANVRAVLSKIQLGEADAGVVYTTDAATVAKDVRLVEIPAQYHVVARYPIAVTKETKNAAAANAWVAFLTGPDGQAIMAKYGFGKP